MATLDEALGLNTQATTQQPQSLDEALGVAPQAQPQDVLPAAKPQVTVPQKAPEPVDPNSVAAGLGRGIAQYKSNVGGTLEALGEATGSESLRQYGQEVRQDNNSDAAAFGQAPDSLLNDPVNYLKSMGLQVAPALATNLGGAYAGQLAGSEFGLPGRAIGGIIGAAVPSFFQNAGAIQNEIKSANPEARSPYTALVGSAPLVALDVIGAKGLIKPAAITAGMTTGQIAKEVAKQGAKGVALESGTGAVAGGAVPLVGAAGAGVSPDWDRVIQGLEAGAVGGAVASTPFAALRGAREVRDASAAVPAKVPSSAPEDNQAQGLKGVAKGFLGSAATNVLEPLANISPSMKEFVRKFRPDESGREATTLTTKEKTDFMAAGWRNDFEEAKAAFSGKPKDFYQALANPTYRQTLSPEDQAAVASARTVLDNVQGTAQHVGLDTGHIADYLPVGPSYKALKKDRTAFVNDLVTDQRSPFYQKPVEANKAVNKYIAMGEYDTNVPPVLKQVIPDVNNPGSYTIDPAYNVKGQADTSRTQYGQVDVPPRMGNLERARFFADVPQDILLKHSQEFGGYRSGKKLDQAVDSYIEGSARRIAFADDFGANGEKANGLLLKAGAEAAAAGRPMTNAELDHAYNLLNAYNGQYQRVQHKTQKTAYNVLSTAATVTTLPFSTIASIPELVLPAVRGDISSAVASFGPAMAQTMKNLAQNTLFKGVPRDQFSKVAADAGLTMASANSIAAARLGDSVLSSWAAKTNRAFFKANMNTYFSHFNRIYAAKTADHIMQRNLHALSSGVDISSAKGAHMAAQLRSMGLPINSNADARAMWDPQTGAMADSARAYRVLGMRRFTDQVVLEPNLGNTPLWMNSGQLHLLAQLKRYPAAFTNVVIPQLARQASPGYAGSYTRAIEGGLATAATVTFMVGLGYLQDYLKMVAKQGTTEPDDQRTEAQVMKDVLSNTVMPIQLSIPLQTMEAQRYGSSAAGPILGPTYSKFENTVKAANSIQSWADGKGTPQIARYLNRTWNPAGQFKAFKDAAKEIDEGL